MTDTISPAATVDAPVCPECRGPWSHSLTFAHARTCSLGAAQGSTIAADNDRLWAFGPFVRDSTDAELALAAALGWPGAPADSSVQTEVRPLTAGSTARRIIVTDGGTRWCAPPPSTQARVSRGTDGLS